MDNRHCHTESWMREAVAALVLAGFVLLIGTLAERFW